MSERESLFDADRWRDPRGWILDALPWGVRRLFFALRMREWPWNIPDGVRFIVCRRPSRAVFAHAKRLADERGWKDVQP